MLHPPPKLRSCWCWHLGGTAREPPHRFHPYVNCSPDPRPGGHRYLQVSPELCLNRHHRLLAGSGRAISWDFVRTPEMGSMPALVLRPDSAGSRLSCALGAVAFSPLPSPDNLKVFCYSFPAETAASSWHRPPGSLEQEECCTVRTVP